MRVSIMLIIRYVQMLKSIHYLQMLFLFSINISNSVAEILRTDCAREGLFTEVEKDKALVGHVIATRSVRSTIECGLACIRSAGCSSYNKAQGDGPTNCELNNQTKVTKPGDLKSKPGNNYYDTQSFSVCHNGGTPVDTCIGNHGVMCRCTPRWTGDDCNIPRLGAVNYMPGPSCHSINNAGDSVGDDDYWIKASNSNSTFQVFCHMSLLGVWLKVSMSWFHSMVNSGVTVTKSEVNGGLTISGSVTNYGCGSGTGSGAIIYIKGYWMKIRYTQEFTEISSCWRIFGNTQFNGQGGAIGKIDHGLYQFNKTIDPISNELYMAGLQGHVFPGITLRCDHSRDNMWQNSVSGGIRRATVTLRRNPSIALAGIFTGTSCGTPKYYIKDIFIYF